MPERKKKRWYSITIGEVIDKVKETEVWVPLYYGTCAFAGYLAASWYLSNSSSDDTEELEDE